MMLKPGTYLQDRYEILSLIGTGGMSEVYQAKCHTLKPSGGDQGFKG